MPVWNGHSIIYMTSETTNVVWWAADTGHNIALAYKDKKVVGVKIRFTHRMHEEFFGNRSTIFLQSVVDYIKKVVNDYDEDKIKIVEEMIKDRFYQI